MTQNNVDTDFVDGLQLIIDSLIKEDESDIFDESTNIEKILPLAALGAVGGAVAGAVGQAVGDVVETGAEAAQQMSDTDEKGEGLRKNTEDLPEADHWCPDVMDWHTSDHESAKAPSVHINVDNHSGDDPYKSENADKDVDKEYDQKTNLPPEFGKPDKGESIAEPFLRKREDAEEDIEKQDATAVPSDMGTGGASPPSPTSAPTQPIPDSHHSLVGLLARSTNILCTNVPSTKSSTLVEVSKPKDFKMLKSSTNTNSSSLGKARSTEAQIFNTSRD